MNIMDPENKKTAMRNCYAGGHEHYKALESDREAIEELTLEPPKSSLSIRALLELYHMGRCYITQSGPSAEGEDALEEIATSIERSCSLSRIGEEARLVEAFEAERGKYMSVDHNGVSKGQTLKGSDEEELTASGICAIILAWILQ